jgi:hypothetical protein
MPFILPVALYYAFVGKNVNASWFFAFARLGKRPHRSYSELLLLALILGHAL